MTESFICSAAATSASTFAGAKIGLLLGFDSDGNPQVDFEGNALGPLCARVALSGLEVPHDGTLPHATLVLVFENADPAKPIIVGILKQSRSWFSSLASLDCDCCKIEVDGGRVSIFAREELQLQCGEGSLTIRKDGKILLRGTNITSRARQTNKIKGGSVQIN